jgi:hypothetical protein
MTPLEQIATQILAMNPLEVRSLVQDYLRRGAPHRMENIPTTTDRRVDRGAHGAASAGLGGADRQALRPHLSR